VRVLQTLVINVNDH